MLQRVSALHSFSRLSHAPLVGGHMVCICASDLQMGCFHLWARVDPATVEIGVQMPVEAPVFSSLGYTPESGIAGSQGDSMFSAF